LLSKNIFENYFCRRFHPYLCSGVSGTTARCTCNGELLEAAMPVPTGSRRLGLEADAGTMEYRHIELKLLP